MPRGMSVHVGVNKPDPSFQMTELRGCVNDAKAMSQIAIDHGFEQLGVFLDQAAKLAPVKQAILTAAQTLRKDDIFLFTFSGHGSTASTSVAEDDGQDETILLNDCILIDNYIRRVLWSKFDEGVRILGVADCCHSGSALLALSFNGSIFNSSTSFFGSLSNASLASSQPSVTTSGLGISARGAGPEIKALRKQDQERIVLLSPEIHNQISHELLTEGKEPKATLLTLAACKDNEDALDGENDQDNSVFTKAMLEVLPHVLATQPPGNYNDLISRIWQTLEAKNITSQHPTRYPTVPDPDFVRQTPFTI